MSHKPYVSLSQLLHDRRAIVVSSLLLHQVLSEATEDNLIDLGPGSPAVVSNMPNAAPSSLPPNVTAPAARPSSPATLASRLAGLGMHLPFQILVKCSLWLFTNILHQGQHVVTDYRGPYCSGGFICFFYATAKSIRLWNVHSFNAASRHGCRQREQHLELSVQL